MQASSTTAQTTCPVTHFLHPHLSMLVQHWFSVLVAHEGVLHDAVVTRRHHDHLLRAKDNLLIVLADVRLRTNFQLCDIAVLVQHMQVVVGRDAEDALAFFSLESHLESVTVMLGGGQEVVN